METAVELVHMPTANDVMEFMPGGFLIYKASPDETILYANQATLKIFGCTDFGEFIELVKGSFRGMIHPEDLEIVEASIAQQVSTNDNYDHVIYRIRRRDGSIGWVDDYGRLVHTEENGDVYYVFLNEFTEHKLTEDEVRRAEDALFCEKRINEAKNTFIFNLSHDLRTPMNAIMGYVQLAEKHIREPEVALGHLKKVYSAGQLLLALIDDLLELSSLDIRGVRIHLVENNLADVVKDATDMFRPEFEAKSIGLGTDLEIGNTHVLVDGPRLQRALSNILSNACKFTPEGGHVQVTISRGEITASGFARFEVAVQDNGCGMSEDFLGRAFQAFEREETSTRSGQVGTGIGLTVTKRIMDIMGGSVRGTSTKGEGSTFVLSMPLKMCEADGSVQERKTEPEIRESVGRGRILLVEDIEINRMMAETILSEFGFDVESVSDGCDAVEAVRMHPEGYYTAVLMDIQMPVMNGYEATRAIRALDRKDVATLPIIALSANSRPEDKEMSFESGMNAHVAKPFDVEGLIATINKYSQPAEQSSAA